MWQDHADKLRDVIDKDTLKDRLKIDFFGTNQPWLTHLNSYFSVADSGGFHGNLGLSKNCY